MKCTDCHKEKEIEKVYILIYETPVCNDCADDRENMALAKEVEERFKRMSHSEQTV